MGFFSLIVIYLMAYLHLISAEDPELIVLVTDNHAAGIFKLDIHTFRINPLNVSTRGPFALDYDHTDRLVYFTDVISKQIRRVHLDGTNDTEIARFNSSSSPEGITLDENTRQVFYTDNGNNLIGRIDMDSLNHTVIVNTGLDKPRGIVADTKNRKLYWIDFGANPKIETSDYNGEDRSTLIFSGLDLPLGITLDEEAGRLYWTDREEIHSVLVSGIDKKTIFRQRNRTLSHISVFNDVLYFTDFYDSPLLVHPLYTDHYAVLGAQNLLRPKGLHVFSPNFDVTEECEAGRYGRDCIPCGACVTGFEICEKTTGVCFIGCQPGYTTPKCNEKCRSGTFGVQCNSTCKCKEHGVCDSVTGSCPNGCQSGWKGDNCSVECEPGTFGENCNSQCPSTCKENTVCDVISGSCPGGCASGWTGDYCTEDNRHTGSGLSTGAIVGIVIGVLAIIAIIVVVVVIVVFIIRKKRPSLVKESTDNNMKGVDNSAYATLEFRHNNRASTTDNDVDTIF